MDRQDTSYKKNMKNGKNKELPHWKPLETS